MKVRTVRGRRAATQPGHQHHLPMHQHHLSAMTSESKTRKSKTTTRRLRKKRNHRSNPSQLQIRHYHYHLASSSTNKAAASSRLHRNMTPSQLIIQQRLAPPQWQWQWPKLVILVVKLAYSHCPTRISRSRRCSGTFRHRWHLLH